MANSAPIGDVRAPQLVGMFGPGSIVNLEKLSVMPSGLSRWPAAAAKISSPTFAKQIGAVALVDTSKLAESGILVTLFPRTFVCRKCGTIQRKDASLNARDLREGFRCYHDAGPLYPSRWIIYCQNGHIDDFNYKYFLHGNKGCEGRTFLITGASLSETWVHCTCGERRCMIDAYGMKAPPMQCSGYSIWLGQPSECSARPKISMRSASDIYFGAVRSGISIEPESDPLVAKTFELLGTALPSDTETLDRAIAILRPFSPFREASPQDLERAVNEFFMARDRPTSYRDRRRQEFDALARSCGSPTDDLYVESLDASTIAGFGFDGLYAVRKLREIRALVGFRRGGMPTDPAFDDVDETETLVPVGPDGMFPAYENRGEGIFLTLDRSWLSPWLARPVVQKRIAAFELAEKRWRESSERGGQQKARGLYVLTHTFAHLLIRQLSLVCGYSQSSLRERIYVSGDDADPWAGLLVYTASSDADGSLGGLVAVATDGRLADVLDEALDSLQICSSDPVCALQVPRGFRKMNGSACHGCVVLPETCCERNNNFLDRTLVVPGTVSEESHFLCYSKPL